MAWQSLNLAPAMIQYRRWYFLQPVSLYCMAHEIGRHIDSDVICKHRVREYD